MSNGTREGVLQRDLERIVKDEAFAFGDNAANDYFDPAEASMDHHWNIVAKFLSPHPIDYTSTLELSCGRGRNSERLADLAKNMTLVDVNPENIQFCKKRFPDKPWKFIVNNGFDLRDIPDASITLVYCLESAVHFDLEIVLSYLKEFRRILIPGGFGFVHHSNVTTNPGADFRSHWAGRAFMSKEIFSHLSIRNGLDIIDQYIFDQGGPEADCFSLVKERIVPTT